jgi:hypothetical protein
MLVWHELFEALVVLRGMHVCWCVCSDLYIFVYIRCLNRNLCLRASTYFPFFLTHTSTYFCIYACIHTNSMYSCMHDAPYRGGPVHFYDRTFHLLHMLAYIHVDVFKSNYQDRRVCAFHLPCIIHTYIHTYNAPYHERRVHR